MIRLFIWCLWGWGREVIVSVTIVLPTAVSAAKAAYVDNSHREDSILVLETQRRNVEARKQTSVVDGAVFSVVWSRFNDSRGQFPERLRGDKHLLIY